MDVRALEAWVGVEPGKQAVNISSPASHAGKTGGRRAQTRACRRRTWRWRWSRPHFFLPSRTLISVCALPPTLAMLLSLPSRLQNRLGGGALFVFGLFVYFPVGVWVDPRSLPSANPLWVVPGAEGDKSSLYGERGCFFFLVWEPHPTLRNLLAMLCEPYGMSRMEP